jgi:hypothetical protein
VVGFCILLLVGFGLLNNLPYQLQNWQQKLILMMVKREDNKARLVE